MPKFISLINSLQLLQKCDTVHINLKIKINYILFMNIKIIALLSLIFLVGCQSATYEYINKEVRYKIVEDKGTVVKKSLQIYVSDMSKNIADWYDAEKKNGEYVISKKGLQQIQLDAQNDSGGSDGGY